MNALTPQGGVAESATEQRMRFMRMRRQGCSCEAILEYRIEQQQQIVQEETLKIAATLLERQKAAEEVVSELIEDMSSIDVLHAAQFQSENISQTVEQLQQIQGNLTASLAQGEKELSEKKVRVETLRKSLRVFSQTLQNAKEGSALEDALFACGKGLSNYISQNMSRPRK